MAGNLSASEATKQEMLNTSLAAATERARVVEDFEPEEGSMLEMSIRIESKLKLQV